MTKQIRQKEIAAAAIFLTIAVIAFLWFLVPRVDSFGTISNQEVDEILYKRLDEYLRAYEEDPRLAKIFTTAMTTPDELTAADRQTYLAYERRFISGWEIAWIYRDDGRFDDHRYSVWDSWYINEVRRRPSFVWTENRKHFSEPFVQHVDESTKEQ